MSRRGTQGEGQLDTPLRLRLHRTMVRIRVFEERVLTDYRAGSIAGFTHSYIGEEAIATGVCAALEQTDYVTSTHRGHGHAIAKGVPSRAIMAELYGKATGCCGGRGGSMHVADFSLGMLGANGIVGGGFGIATGAALSITHRGSGQVVVCFFGDGGINKGTFHEALNFASAKALPVVFVCENNRFAQFTAVERVTSVADLSIRAEAYGIPGQTIDGNDVELVLETARTAVARARSGDGPSLLCMDTYRFEGHNVGDPEAYRSKDEVEQRRQNDPLPRYEAVLAQAGVLGEPEKNAVWEEALAEVEDAAAYAEASPAPDPASVLDDLFTPSAEVKV